MKTLADLKKDLSIGTPLTMTFNSWGKGKFIDVKRYIIKKQSNGVTIGEKPTDTKGSFLDYPKASLMEYDGQTLKIFEAGHRPLTENEQNIINNAPSCLPENKQLVENDLMTDGSTTFFMDEAYFDKLDAEYLKGHKEVRGLKYNFNDQNIRDNSIRGQLSMQYTIN